MITNKVNCLVERIQFAVNSLAYCIVFARYQWPLSASVAFNSRVRYPDEFLCRLATHQRERYTTFKIEKLMKAVKVSSQSVFNHTNLQKLNLGSIVNLFMNMCKSAVRKNLVFWKQSRWTMELQKQVIVKQQQLINSVQQTVKVELRRRIFWRKTVVRKMIRTSTSQKL